MKKTRNQLARFALAMMACSPALAAEENAVPMQSAEERAVRLVADQAMRDAMSRSAEANSAWEQSVREKAEKAARVAAKTIVAESVAAAAKEAAASAAKAAAAKTAEALGTAASAKAEAKEERFRIDSRVIKVNHVGAEEVADKLNAMWNGEFGVNWKLTKIAVAFPESNAILLTAPKPILEACEHAVAALDVEVPQVYIEARFVELANNASHKLGIDWSMLDGMKGTLNLDAGYNKRKMDGVSTYNSDGTYTVGRTITSEGYVIEPQNSSANLSHINAAIGMSEMSIVLRALESSEDARIFSNPKIIVSSGKKATVDMTTKYPNVSIAVKRTNNGSDSESIDLDMKMTEIPGQDSLMFAKEAFFSWGISLDVTPRISTNGLINVTIVPTISSLDTSVEASGFVQSADTSGTSSKYPVINVQRLLTEFNMSSGTTAVIGGLSRTVERQVDNGIPWLRDWWWIGPRLFGSKQRVKEQKEIIVFVTVGLVDPRHIAKDAGLPKNAVLGRQYTDDTRREPGDRKRTRPEGMGSLDLRSLEEQYHDPRRTNRTNRVTLDEYIPFTRDPNFNSGVESNKDKEPKQ